MSVKEIIDNIIKVEGGYSNDPKDAGGETMYGITIAVARKSGYTGPMRDMPRQVAYDIYLQDYWLGPKFDQVARLSEKVAEELCDTGVNCGVNFAKPLLQRALNLLNNEAKAYPDIVVDGDYGPATMNSLTAFLASRGKPGETVLLKMLNVMQGSRYIDLAERKPSQERYIFGWFDNRIEL